MDNKIYIRLATSLDWDGIWRIIKPVIAKGDTYVFEPGKDEKSMKMYWMSPKNHVYVAEKEGEICGSYILKDNHEGLGSHIANGSYMVHPESQGHGIGKLLGQHSILEAEKNGYHAIQFNLVVKSNKAAVSLWKKLGFEITGEIPDAFQHKELGLTNAYIMYRSV